ncbi:sensor histidine kinase [Bowmanella yangjiangensis]|nr:ATP-binding protein [Bowmanella yangjiangensis]
MQQKTANILPTKGKRLSAHLSLMTVLWGFMALVVGVLAYYQGETRIEEQAWQRLIELSSKLEIELDKYRTLPKVLTLHPDVEQVLTVTDAQTLHAANSLLARYNESLSSDVVYLLNIQGITLASSNWQSEDSFVGSDYRFRPYFQQAAEGQAGSYFALGTVSGRRGYYFSYPVHKEGKVIGVLVIKVALAVLEENWPEEAFDFLLTDVHGVVFYSSYPQWNYQTLAMLAPEVEHQLLAQKQYGNGPIAALTRANGMPEVLLQPRLNLNKDGRNETFLQVHKDMSTAGWRLFALAPMSLIYQYVIWSLLLYSVLFLLVYLISFSWRRTVEARKQLAAINEQLEHRVDERTAELSQSNEQLKAIIEKYKQTELTLKRTQNELIQAGKLAMLGEMAASINHELNQPLAAMRIYTETLQLLAGRGDIQAIKENANEILKLNKMMAKIIGQYKLFARKSAGKTGPVSVTETLTASLAILDNKMQKMGIRIDPEGLSDTLQVMADAIPLEQVIINLLNNALQAVGEQASPHIVLRVEQHQEALHLVVEDNGPGFADDELERVFEPFYTTKGQGLGLGLTISKRIVESFDGHILAENGAGGGARFVVVLNRYIAEDIL